MSLHYLLDGYNILHQMSNPPEMEFDQQRLSLIQFIENKKPQGSQKNKVVLYFDGKPGKNSHQEITKIQIVFTYEKSADRCIKDEVERAKNAKNMIVVTDDREIQYFIKAHGAKSLPVQEFLNKGEKKSSGASSKNESKAGTKRRSISKSKEFKINEELEDVWLKKKDE